MIKLFNILFVLATLAVAVWSETKPVSQCSGCSFDDLNSRITVLPCESKKCKLTKGTNTTVAFKFIPKNKVTCLVNKVFAQIGVISLPFIGVAGENACGAIKRADTGKPAPCPLQPGHEYIYENHFPIREFYPETLLTVHWSLNDQHDNQVICFEVPAAIVACKSESNN